MAGISADVVIVGGGLAGMPRKPIHERVEKVFVG